MFSYYLYLMWQGAFSVGLSNGYVVTLTTLGTDSVTEVSFDVEARDANGQSPAIQRTRGIHISQICFYFFHKTFSS